MTKPMVYFDLDNTLMNTSRLLENIAASLSTTNIPEELFYAQLQQYSNTLERSTLFNPDKFLKQLTTAVHGLESERIQAAFYQASNFSEALFPDVEHVIPRLSQVATLGIYSQGEPSWQKTKLEKSGLLPYFRPDQLIIESNKLDATIIDRLQKNSFLIDDRPDVVQLVKQVSPTITTIQIIRDGQDHNDQQSVSSLTEVAALVTREL